MVVKLHDRDNDLVYVNPQHVALVTACYNEGEKENGAIVHVKTGMECARITVTERPEEVAVLLNTTELATVGNKKSNSRKKAVDGE
jgi:hypothetical protein